MTKKSRQNFKYSENEKSFYDEIKIFFFITFKGLSLKQEKYFFMEDETPNLTLPVLCILESCIEIKIKLNFYFQTSLWCLKRFYEGL